MTTYIRALFFVFSIFYATMFFWAFWRCIQEKDFLVALITFLSAMLFVISASVVAFPKGRLKSNRKPIKKPKSERLSFPATFFMPFCVCPKCDVEQIHWMTESDLSEAENVNTAWIHRYAKWVTEGIKYREKLSEHYNSAFDDVEDMYEHRYPEPKPTDAEVFAEEILKGKFEVIRECRECEYRWGQKVGVGRMLEEMK